MTADGHIAEEMLEGISGEYTKTITRNFGGLV
jgi:hypothetical protein